MNKNIRPCLKCGSKNIKVWDCGYSSFNCGGVKCEDCGNEIKSQYLSCYPEDDLISIWNRNNPTPKKRIKELKKEIELLEKSIEELEKNIK